MAWLIVFGKAVLGQAAITDPVADFRATYDMTGVTKICKLQVDLNDDGKSDVLLAPIEPDMDSQYPGWFVYLAQADGSYVLAGEKTDAGVDRTSLPSFNIKKYKIGHIAEIGKYGLLTLICGTGGQAKCQLHAIIIEGDGFKDIPIGQPVSAEENYDQLAQRFPTPYIP